MRCRKSNALVVRIFEFMTFLKMCSLTWPLAPGFARPHMQFVSNECMVVTRLALYCVCDHEHFMSFDIALLFNTFLDVLRNLLVPCRHSLGIRPPSCEFCLET